MRLRDGPGPRDAPNTAATGRCWPATGMSPAGVGSICRRWISNPAKTARPARPRFSDPSRAQRVSRWCLSPLSLHRRAPFWGPMAASDRFVGAVGRATWSGFVFYPTRRPIRVVTRQATAPAGAALTPAVQLRLRVRNFAAIAGCRATDAVILHRKKCRQDGSGTERMPNRGHRADHGHKDNRNVFADTRQHQSGQTLRRPARFRLFIWSGRPVQNQLE